MDGLEFAVCEDGGGALSRWIMTRLLDPRNDLVFRRIFGEHPEILRDFLNSLLPLPAPIVNLEYLSADQMPLLPVFKRGIVDVKCRDEAGRQFIVEMQMQWTNAFLQRVLFNASQAYVKQLEPGGILRAAATSDGAEHSQ